MKGHTCILCLILALNLIACGGGGGGGDSTNNSTNSVPIANAGIDQNVKTGSWVMLDGRGSTDADGDVLTFTWAIQSTPPGSSAVLSSTTVANPTFVADRDGSYVVRLVVSDGLADSASDTLSVTAATLNFVPVADAGTDQNVRTGSLVRLDGYGSTDADGDVLTFAWAIQSTPPGSSAVLSSTAAANPTFVADRDGAYVVRLVVSDGRASASDTVSVTATTTDMLVTISKLGASISGTSDKWWGGVRGPDGKIYGIPYGAEDILIIDPATNSATRSTLGANLSGLSKWANGCLGPDGKIYCVPYDAPDVLIIDPKAGTAIRTSFGLNLTDTDKWAGAVLERTTKFTASPAMQRASSSLTLQPGRPHLTPWGRILPVPLNGRGEFLLLTGRFMVYRAIPLTF